jgi:hypothetical protein
VSVVFVKHRVLISVLGRGNDILLVREELAPHSKRNLQGFTLVYFDGKKGGGTDQERTV